MQTFNHNNLLVLPFDNRFLSLPRILKVFNVNVVFKNSATVRSFLVKNSPFEKTGCIYEIPCNNCDKKYIGQSGKVLATRINQHKYCVRVGNMSSALFLHMNNCNHSIDWRNSKEMLFCNDIVKRNIIESSIIKFKSDCVLNISKGLYKLDNWIIKGIVKQLRIM